MNVQAEGSDGSRSIDVGSSAHGDSSIAISPLSFTVITSNFRVATLKSLSLACGSIAPTHTAFENQVLIYSRKEATSAKDVLCR